MSTISTHVLDTALGQPAVGVAVTLERLGTNGTANLAGFGATDADGRLRDFASAVHVIAPGHYRLRFDTGAYFAATDRESFYPSVTVEFRVAAEGHYHVPLLLSPYGYSTYRGS